MLGTHRYLRQPLIALVLCCLALVALLASWLNTTPAQAMHWAEVLMAVGLLGAVVLAGHFPIHIRFHTKVSITSVPLYLLAVLLPPPLAAVTAALAILSMELALHAKRGNYPSDIATSVARTLLVVLLGATVYQMLESANVSQLFSLNIVGLVMLVSDMLLTPLEFAPMTGEPFVRVLVINMKEGWLIEGVQYLLGVLGAAVAFVSPWMLGLLALPMVFVYGAFKRAMELQTGTRRVVEAMADAVDLRDPYTGGHSRRVTDLCQQILSELDLSGPEADLILTAARVHDIGKISVPDTILLKPGVLTAEEEAVMKTHAAQGAKLLERYPDFRRGVAVVRHHHERWDGQGYPEGLAGYAIPFGARVIAVADTFDAITTDRPYAMARPVAVALAILEAGRGQQWDPTLVDALMRSLARAQEAERMEQESERSVSAGVHEGTRLSSTG